MPITALPRIVYHLFSQIEDLGKTIEKRESNAEKIEKRIKNARVCV